jgi:hypothetical protein
VIPGEVEQEPQREQRPEPAGAVPRKASRSRVLEWFWRRGALAELDAKRVQDPRALEFERRARTAAELATRTLSPAGHTDAGATDATACDLYRQAAYWALLRLEADRNPLADVATDPPSVSEVFARADLELLSTAAGGRTQALEIKRELGVDSFLPFVELSPETQGRLARRAHAFVQGLFLVLDAGQRSRDALLFGRLVRVGLLVALLGTVLLVALKAGEFMERRKDLAAAKAWRTSSVLMAGCNSPAQTCPENLNFFFHTVDEAKPWIQIDLGRPERFSRVRVVNRKDCCAERAAPLMIEVSTNGKDWKEVSRNPVTFTNWLAKFSPVDARWVRLRADRKTMLHLAQVRVLP